MHEVRYKPIRRRASAIHDLKEGSGLEHCPSGNINANAAWTVLASIAHNLVRWVGSLGFQITGPLVTKTIRRTFLALPGHFRFGTTAIPSSADKVARATQWSEYFTRLVTVQT